MDGLTGYGAEGLADWLSCFSKKPILMTMYYAIVCQAVFARIASEKKGRSAYQQGVVGKIEF